MRCGQSLQFSLLLAIASLISPSLVAAGTPKRIDTFALNDHLGTRHSFDDWKEKKAIVVAFLGTECPLARLYSGRLQELADRFSDRGVHFVGINSNQQDSLAEITADVRRRAIRFPMLKDPGNRVADQFGATRTPEVFLLGPDGTVHYRGRIDDQYGVGYARPDSTQKYLKNAIDDVLADRPVRTPETETIGCLIGRVPVTPAAGDVTYSNQIARILQKRCVECHREGQIAPLALTSYDEVAGWAETIREVIRDQRMPPWHANPAHGVFRNDARMPYDEKKLIDQWVENGTPEGDPSQLPAPAAFHEGWRIPKPDLVLRMPEAYRVPGQGVIDYKYFIVDPGFKKDMWIRAAEGRPGNREVVHHLVLFYMPPGQDRPRPENSLVNIVASFAPGMPALVAPDGYARRIPAGSKLVFQMHYTPNGTEQTDQSEVGLQFADESEVEKELLIGASMNLRFRIPAGADNHQVDSLHRFRQDTLIYALVPHMHLRGKSFAFTAASPDQKTEVLLDVPKYDFNWQNIYVFEKPRLMPDGSELRCVAHFDNSERNLGNPNPNETVRFGEQTFEEMMVGMFYYTSAEQNLKLGAPRVTPLGSDRYQVTFRYKPGVKSSAVYLAGEFNAWKPSDHRMEGPDADGSFTTTVEFGKGSHEYKFVIDGKQWKQDPGNREQAGYYHNSVVKVGL
ncbi:MAG: redoxin domain-containing protein [Planctomycetaceae bacterium]